MRRVELREGRIVADTTLVRFLINVAGEPAGIVYAEDYLGAYILAARIMTFVRDHLVVIEYA